MNIVVPVKTFSKNNILVNELLENCVKYSSMERPVISFTLRFFDGLVSIETINYSLSSNVHYLDDLNQRLLVDKSDTSFFDHLCTMDADTEISQLGLINLYQYHSFNMRLFTDVIRHDLYRLKVCSTVLLHELRL